MTKPIDKIRLSKAFTLFVESNIADTKAGKDDLYWLLTSATKAMLDNDSQKRVFFKEHDKEFVLTIEPAQRFSKNEIKAAIKTTQH